MERSFVSLSSLLVVLLVLLGGSNGVVLEYSEGMGYDDIRKPIFFFFFSTECESNYCQEVLKILKELSVNDLHEDVAFIHVEKNKFPGVTAQFDSDLQSPFTFKLVQDDKVYTFANSPQKESLSAFIQAPHGATFPLPPALRRVKGLCDSTYQDALTKGDWFLFVYVPWSGRCRRMQNIMDDIARDPRLPYELKIAKINLLEEIEFLHQFGIDRIEQYFPVFYRLRNGKYEFYNGTLDHEEIVDYLLSTEQTQHKMFPHDYPPQLGMFDHFWYGAEDYFHGPTPFVVCTFVVFLSVYMYLVLRTSSKKKEAGLPSPVTVGGRKRF